MSVCRGCGKQIIWMRTAEGKAMPCDPEVHKVYAGGKKESFLSLNGHMVRGASLLEATSGNTHMVK